MATIDVLDILHSKKQTPLEFDYDNLWIPPMNMYLTPQDVESLRRIATSLKLSSKIELKYKMIDDIMRNRGFKRFSAGTNRVVYSFLEDTRFVVKIAVDRVGMQDNPMEYKNQAFLKPYCTKMFYISPCGTVGFAERVLPIKNRREFKEIAPDVFEILVNKILGNYVMEDIGTKFFMNYGVRANDGPVLLDYPFIYKLDGKKLFCNKVHPLTNEPCNGEIDYDAGFNHLVCTRCGKIYLATDLRDDSIDNKIIIKGGIQMKIMLKKGDKIISTPVPVDDVMVRPKKRPEYKTGGLVVKASGGSVKEKEQNENTIPDAGALEQSESSFENMHKQTEVAEVSKETVVSNTADIPMQNTDPADHIDEKSKTVDETTSSNDSSDINKSDKNEDINTEDTNVEFDTRSNFINGSNDDTTGKGKKSNNSTKSNKASKENVESKESSNKSSATKTSSKKTSTVTNSSEIVSDEDNLDKYADYETGDDTPAYQPIRKKRGTMERDANGRFVSSGNGKKKTTRIPSK